MQTWGNNMSKPLPSQLLLLVLCLLALNVARSEARLEKPGALDLAYMQQQTDSIDEIAARQLGRRLQQSQSDLSLLQTILERQLIKPDDDAGLQAMGIALGNVLAAQHDLDWVIYLDERGRSRALSIGPEQQCLFPSTMISRRVKAGAEVNVQALYDKAGRTIAQQQARGLKTY
jgi:hypothetical protein